MAHTILLQLALTEVPVMNVAFDSQSIGWEEWALIVAVGLVVVYLVVGSRRQRAPGASSRALAPSRALPERIARRRGVACGRLGTRLLYERDRTGRGDGARVRTIAAVAPGAGSSRSGKPLGVWTLQPYR